MKSFVKISIILSFSTLFLVACKEKSSPADVAVGFYNALTSGNMTFPKENVCFPDVIEYEVFCDFLDLMASKKEYKNAVDGYKADYTALATHIMDDVAYVNLQGVTVTGKNVYITARLLLVDGRWKIDGRHAALSPSDTAK